MRCLYCGKELALLKRLTRGGEFCSDAHKQSYQEEYNRLGLSRLLQARTRADESKVAHRPPEAPVAVVDRPAEEEAAAEVPEVAVGKVTAPPHEAAPVVIAAPPEPPAPAMAGFAMETPAISAPPEPVSYLEPSIADGDPQPTAPAWRLEGPSGQQLFFTLPSAELVPLDLQPGVCRSSYSVMDTSVSPREGGQPRVQLSMPLTLALSHEFQRGGSVAIEVAPRPSESSSYTSLSGALDFAFPAGVRVFDLLDLAPAGIAYPAEECEVTVPQSWTNGVISDAPVDIIVPAIPQDIPAPELPPEPAPVRKPEATPRAALEALSRLHKDMRERDEAKPSEATPEAPEAALKSPADPVEASLTESLPREASELLAISLKSFAPPKASPIIDASALLTNGQPLLPRLKGLPLRPKVAPAPRGLGQTKTAAPRSGPAKDPKAKADQSSAAAPKDVKQTPPVADKAEQSATIPKPPPTGGVDNPAQPPLSKNPVQTAEAAPAKQSPPAPATPVQPGQPKATAKPAPPEQSAKPVPVKITPAAPKTSPIPAEKSTPAAATVGLPAKEEAVQKGSAVKDERSGKAAAATSANTDVPNFGAVVNTSMFGSLNAKLGIAAVVILIAIVGYFGFVNKSKPPAPPPKVSDGVGMSIMVGEGGWVEGWAGDPIGLHGGRQITIYRPSLKLSDYRMEFQAQIDSKSIGWIFRAADPENYYAAKLELVSPELPLTVVLYKYMVLKSRQVQVGRVPIDIPLKMDTVFNIRVDVRGPKFTTYVQGQPVDVWTDDQIRSGGAGFLNERNERGKIKSVSLSYLSGGTK